MTDTARQILSRQQLDELAPGYDGLFGHGDRGDWMRRRVQETLLKRFRPGDRILELGCGTGTDAVMLAKSGVSVTATDISPAMAELTARKIRLEGVEALVRVAVVDAGRLENLGGHMFDGAFSNFNVLNYLDDLDGFSDRIGGLLRPGAPLICTLLNSVCLWEVLYFAATMKPVRAFRRMTRRNEELMAGQAPLALRLYRPGVFARMLSRDFTVRRITGYGLLLPPAGFAPPAGRWEWIFRLAERLEKNLSGFPFYSLCDHYVIELERKALP